MTVNLSALAGAGQQFFDNNGNPLSGGKLWSYQAGTTTPKTTYTTSAGNVAHTNPIVLDAAGRVATGEIWLTAGENYKFVLMTSANVTLATWDNITGINGTGIASNAVNVQYDPAGTGATSRTAQAKLRDTISVKDFGAVGDPAVDDTAALQAAITYSISQNKWLDGVGGTYYAGGLVFSSGFKLQNITIINNKNADLISVLQTVDTVLVENVELENVNLDGNRNTQTNIEGTTSREDGGRHAMVFRGECQNVTLTNCTFNNSAADGLCFFAYGSPAQYNIRDVKIFNCDFIGNRRHGISGDTIDGFFAVNCRTNSNGLNTAGGYPDNNGHTGDKSAGLLYGNGVDIEEYDNSKGSRNITFLNCEAVDNARGGYLILRTNAASASTEFGFYSFINCVCNKGGFSTTSTSIEITPINPTPSVTMFQNVWVQNCNLVDGRFMIRAGSAYVTRIKTSIAQAVQALELATVTTDSSSYYFAANGTILKLAITPQDYSFLTTGISRGVSTIGTYTDTVLTSHGIGDSYQFNVVDSADEVRGSFQFAQLGTGEMRFVVRGGGPGLLSNYMSADQTSTLPGNDNLITLGSATNRWSVVYAGTGTINTSDVREKQDIQELSDAEKRVAVRIKGLIRKFRFKDAVVEKAKMGKTARLHVGVIAQEVATAFQLEGLDPAEYGVFCYDEWDDLPEIKNERDIVLRPFTPAGNRFGVRYEELMSFVLGAI